MWLCGIDRRYRPRLVKMRKWLLCIFLIVGASIFFSTGFSHAQNLSNQYLITSWTQADGLPQNSVTDIHQTRDGYLWMTTFGGLVRFDGLQFTVFDVANTLGLSTNRTTALHEDATGALWIGHENGSLTRYYDGVFEDYSQLEGLPKSIVWDLESAPDSALWIGSQTGLARLHNREITSYAAQMSPPSGIVRSLLWDQNDTLWIGTPEGLTHWADGVFSTLGEIEGLPKSAVKSTLEDQQGRIWIGTNDGIALYQNGTFTLAGSHIIADIVDLVEGPDGSVWFGANSNLYRLTPTLQGAPITELVHTFPAGIRTLFFDQEGNLWIGTGGAGLHRLRPKPLTHYSLEEGLPRKDVYRITEDGLGGLWISTGCGYLTHFQAETFTTIFEDDQGAPLGCIFALYLDEEGGLWMARNTNLSRYQNGTFTTYTVEDGLPGTHIFSIFEDRDGHIWIGTGEQGVARFDGSTFTRYTTQDGLVNNNVRFITQTRDGALWFGTGEGISRLQGTSFINYTAQDGAPKSMIRAIHEDADGVLWFGSYGGGLARFKDGLFTQYTMAHGLFDNTISRILEDEKSNLWMLGNLGLFYVNRRQLNAFAEGQIPSISSVSFAPEDGMIEGNGGGQPAGWQTDDGRMWFPTIDGMVMIDANNFKPNDIPPPVAIERVGVDGKALNLQEIVEAPPGPRDLEILYTGLSLIKPQAVRFKYRLDGYDEDWIDAGNRRDAFYTRIPPGTYTFRVMAANNDGVWSTEEATYTFTLAPYFYETTWFYGLCGLLALLLGYAAFQVRTRNIRSRNRALQAEIDERKRAENALRASEDKFARVFRSSPDAIMVTSLQDGKIIDVNDGFEKRTGYTRAEVVGLTTPELNIWANPSDRDVFLQSLQTEGRLINLEAGVRIKSGDIRACLISAEPLEIGGRPCVVSITRDITERKRAEMALMDSEARYRSVVTAMSEGIVLYDATGNIVTANESAARILGIDKERMYDSNRSRNALQVIHVDGTPYPTENYPIAVTLREGKPLHNVVLGIKRPDDEITWLSVNTEPLFLEDRKTVSGAVSSFTDISARKQVEAEREHLIQKLENQNAELERFTYTVSHDLKSPLVTIKGFLGLLRQDAAAGRVDYMNKDIDQIGAATDQMHRLLDELLELSRIGRLVNEPEQVALDDLARDATNLVAGQISERGVAIDIDLDIPTVCGDRTRLIEVFQNLIENAVKFMGNQANPHIEVGGWSENGQVFCFVRDNGMGIDMQYQEKVFGLFDRLDTSIEGTGIGLALVRRIVEVHGGRIWVESDGVERGSTFFFTLPHTKQEQLQP